jgi:hypothetical protein
MEVVFGIFFFQEMKTSNIFEGFLKIQELRTFFRNQGLKTPKKNLMSLK